MDKKTFPASTMPHDSAAMFVVIHAACAAEGNTCAIVSATGLVNGFAINSVVLF